MRVVNPSLIRVLRLPLLLRLFLLLLLSLFISFASAPHQCLCSCSWAYRPPIIMYIQRVTAQQNNGNM